jgi:hypothetical protein
MMAAQPLQQQCVTSGRQHQATLALLWSSPSSGSETARVLQKVKDVFRYTLLQIGRVHGRYNCADDNDDLHQGRAIMEPSRL